MIGFDFFVFYSSFFVANGIGDMVDATEDHWAQGFYWRPGEICFLIPHADESVRVEWGVVDSHPEIEREALRAMEMPFVADGRTQVATLPDDEGRPLDILPGAYSLRFVLLPGFEEAGERYCYRIRLTFVAKEDGDFAILRTGHQDMTATEVLARNAEVDARTLGAIAILHAASGDSSMLDDLIARGVVPPKDSDPEQDG